MLYFHNKISVETIIIQSQNYIDNVACMLVLLFLFLLNNYVRCIFKCIQPSCEDDLAMLQASQSHKSIESHCENFEVNLD